MPLHLGRLAHFKQQGKKNPARAGFQFRQSTRSVTRGTTNLPDQDDWPLAAPEIAGRCASIRAI
jgi:hypothetical protein